MFFEEALEDLDLGTSFAHAPNGKEAIEILSDGRGRLPDIVFLDLNMPLMSGHECLERIRRDEGLKNLKVVIYSTSFDPVTVDFLHDIGANHYIRKPGAFKDLKRTISAAISSLERDKTGPVPKSEFVILP